MRELALRPVIGFDSSVNSLLTTDYIDLTIVCVEGIRYAAMSRTNIRWLIVGLLGVCILGVLILPQVDLPDFILNSSSGPRVILSNHLRTNSPSVLQALPERLSSNLFLSRFDTHRLVLLRGNSNMNLVLKTTSALRC